MLGRLVAVFTFSRRTDCLTGRAKVIDGDGDTIVVAGQLVRLHGIDAPELDETFWWRGEHSLRHDVVGRPGGTHGWVNMRCQAFERERHGRLVTKVYSPNGVDVGRRLVAAGWALAYRRYSTDYVDAENKARRGMWRGTFVKPWEWRASSPPRRPQASMLSARVGARRQPAGS